MSNIELLRKMEIAVNLFSQREKIQNERKRLRSNITSNKKERKIGIVGIVILVLEIICYIKYFLGALMLLYAPKDELESLEYVEEMNTLAIVIIVVGLGIIITTYLLLRMYNIRRNKKVRLENKRNAELNKKIYIADNDLKEELSDVQNKIDKYVSTWYPNGYESSYIASYFYDVIYNDRARTLGEAVNLYEEDCYRRKQLEYNQKIYEENKKQTVMQGVQIAELAAANAQLSKTNKELQEQNRLLKKNNK